jgi:tryptophanyl-tRNA synthetase
MSKSYGNTIPLFAEDAEIEKLVMSIVTDSGGTYSEEATINHVPLATNVFKIHSLFRNPGELIPIYNEKTREKNYKFLKEMLIEDVKTLIRPLREKRKAIAADTNAVLKILKNGSLRAKEKASAKMDEVREKVGVKLY